MAVYEVAIGDWGSDVFSSDLTPGCTSSRRPATPWNRAPAGACTAKAAAVTRGTPCTVDPAGALLHWHGLPTTARRALHERGPQPHRGLSRHLRSDHQRPRRPGRSSSALVRLPDSFGRSHV